MKNYLILYCAYAPDDYMGHRKLFHQANSLEEAEAHARKVMAARIDGRPYEYHVYEIAADGGPRLHTLTE